MCVCRLVERRASACCVIAALLLGVASLGAQSEAPVRVVFPSYPEFMKEAGRELTIEIRVEVSPSGLVIEASPSKDKRSNPTLFFIGGLLGAVWQWRYSP